MTTKIRRARVLLGFMTAAEAIEVLVGSGVARADAFLAVQAATILLKD